MKYGWVSHIQKYSVRDGPGIRTTVFLKGCPLDCWWCHNPENRSPQPELLVVEGRCIRCGECVKVCPDHIISPTDTHTHPSRRRKRGATEGRWLSVELAVADHDLEEGQPQCRRCGACVQACPTGARQITGRRMSVEQVLREILKDNIFYEDSRGGVTFSGGEPLQQPVFLQGLLSACRDQGIHTALDTCGYEPQKKFLATAALADLILYDLKIMDEAKHEQFTGSSNRSILANLKALVGVHSNIWIRIPIIPGLNDTEDEIAAMAKLAGSLPGVRQIHLLPYHQTGVAKFKRLGQTYRMHQITPPSPDYMAAVVERFNRRGLTVKSNDL